MLPLFSKFWWSFVFRGLAAVLFGLTISWGTPSLDLLVLAFGLFALLQGVFSVIPGLSKLGGRIYFLLIEGVVGILAGVFTFLGPGIGRMVWPEIATVTLVYFIAFWALLTGAAELIGSLRLPGEVKERRMISLSGVVCFFLTLLLLLRTGPGATGNASVIGIFGMVIGLLWLFTGLKARGQSARMGKLF